VIFVVVPSLDIGEQWCSILHHIQLEICFGALATSEFKFQQQLAPQALLSSLIE